MATGMRIGWRKLMTLAAAQMAVPTITTRRTTQQAVSAAQIILRCHGVGCPFIYGITRLSNQLSVHRIDTTR